MSTGRAQSERPQWGAAAVVSMLAIPVLFLAALYSDEEIDI